MFYSIFETVPFSLCGEQYPARSSGDVKTTGRLTDQRRVQERTSAMLDGRVGPDTKYDELPDGADLQSSERAGQAWHTEQD